MTTEMWMTHNGGKERLRFPVLPEKYKIKHGTRNDVVNIRGLGEVVIKGDPSAIELGFSSFFPSKGFPALKVVRLEKPHELAERITRWQISEQPVLFTITNTPINMYFAIEQFEYEEVGGDVGTVHYDIRLKEYKEVKARQVEIQLPKLFNEPAVAIVPNSSAARVDNRTTPKTHTVQKGDTLWGIAKKHLGNGNRWGEIHNLNKDKIKNPNLIYPGQVFKLP